MNHQSGELPLYQHISRNEFVTRKHTKQNEEDIAVCECIYDPANGDSACGETCLNVLTSTECTPGHCPCGVYCKNQKFQKCEYAKTRFFKTEGRGWGLLADENIQAGQFVIEYCGEVITWTEARRRSHAYEFQGIKDAYIICLNASECIDATAKGSHARFINHSCQPNCETRKWNVLGEIRVGIFAKQDIPAGTELGYNYNFEWYGGAKVRCLCGSPNCSGFLGAKSRGFQEDTYVWEDDDDRYSVEKIPLYDSAEDEPAVELPKTLELSKSECDLKGENEYSTSSTMNASIKFEPQIESTSLPQSLESSPMEGIVLSATKSEESEEMKLYKQGAQGVFPKKGAMISRIRSNSTCRNYNIGSGSMPKRRSQHYSNGKLKQRAQKQVDAKHVVRFLASKEAQEEVLRYEEKKNEAASQLASLYDEIRPAIEEHERDSQDSVATSVAEKWIEASCMKMKTEFDLYSSIIKNLACTPIKAKTPDQPKPSEAGDNGSEKKSLGS